MQRWTRRGPISFAVFCVPCGAGAPSTSGRRAEGRRRSPMERLVRFPALPAVSPSSPGADGSFPDSGSTVGGVPDKWAPPLPIRPGCGSPSGYKDAHPSIAFDNPPCLTAIHSGLIPIPLLHVLGKILAPRFFMYEGGDRKSTRLNSSHVKSSY